MVNMRNMENIKYDNRRNIKKYIPKNAKNKNIALILNVKPQYLSNVLSDIKTIRQIFK